MKKTLGSFIIMFLSIIIVSCGVSNNYDTLNNEKIEFSLDKGNTFNIINNKLEEFDIWREQINTEVSDSVFFYAFTYDEFLNKVDEAKKTNIYTYRYFTEEGFDFFKEQYNEEYFEDNILIFYYKFEPNISENYVYSLTKNKNTLTLNINRFEGMATALSAWMEVITIKKTDIEGVTKVNLIVRTISEKVSYIFAYIDDNYIRDFYINGKTIDDFAGLDNLKEIILYRRSLNVDLRINESISDEDLTLLVNYLESSQHVISTGYKGKDFIRVQLNHSFYDEVVNKTLIIYDFFKDEDLIEEYLLTINILNFSPFGYIQLFLDEKGKEFAEKMVSDLKEINYPFIKK